jgi:hypothetical protein
MRDNVPDYLLFEKKSKNTFSILVDKFNYKLVDEVGRENYVRHVYKNILRRREVTIENQTFPVDYGFSFSVRNLLTKETIMLYNIPWEKQDASCNFLERVKDKIFLADNVTDILKGTKWKNLNSILFEE